MFRLSLALALILGMAGLCGQEEDAVLTDFYGDPLPAGALARAGSVRSQPGDLVWALTFDHARSRLASGGHFGIVHLWDIDNGRELHRFEHLDEGRDRWARHTRALTFSPDDSQLFEGEGDTITVRDVESGKTRSPASAAGRWYRDQ